MAPSHWDPASGVVVRTTGNECPTGAVGYQRYAAPAATEPDLVIWSL